MKTVPLISIIVPVYNVKNYLQVCVESILGQSLRDFELLLIDDGSTDGSADLCDAYAAAEDRIRTVHLSNGGPGRARNTGLSLAKGHLIGFVDSDDWIEPDFYESLYQMLSRCDADIAACGFVKITDRAGLAFCSKEAQICCMTAQEALRSMFEPYQMRYSPCNKLYRRELFDHIRYPEDLIFEDKATTYQLIHASRRVAYMPSAKYHYYIRPDSVMRGSLNDHHFDLFEVNERLIAFMEVYYPELAPIARQSYAQECEKLLERLASEGGRYETQRSKCQAVAEAYGIRP